MATLNEYASRIAGILGRQDDHTMLERVKDSFKAIFATRIRQSISKYGIDDLLTITCKIPIVVDASDSMTGFHILKTTTKVPTPVRFQNDAAFISITSDGEPSLPFSSRTLIEIKLSSKHSLSGFTRAYEFKDGYIKLYIRSSYLTTLNHASDYKFVFVRTIFENPEQVIALVSSEDMSDIELPFPTDMLEGITLEILKTEFNRIPPEVEIKS